MTKLTVNTSQTIVSKLIKSTANNTSGVNVTNIINALANVKSTTFATLTQASKVSVSAKHKEQIIYKLTVQNVTLCNSNASLYENAVNRSVKKASETLNTTAEEFTSLPSNYVMINDSYSVCALKSNTNKHYLRATVNKCLETAYYCVNTNKLLSKEQVAEFLTPSAAKTLLRVNTSQHIKHADVVHAVTVRSFSLANIYSINVAKQTLSC